MAAPFLDMDTLTRDVNALNNFSDLIGGYIASLDIGEDGTVFNKDEKYIGLKWSGSIGDFNLEMTPDSGAKYEDIHYNKDPFTGKKYIDSGYRVQFRWPVAGRAFGQDEIVKSGFETITPQALDAESEADQTLSLNLHGAGDVRAPFSGDVSIKVETWELGLKNPDINFSVHGEGEVDAFPEQMKSLLHVPIAYDDYNLKVDIGEYKFADFDFDPDMMPFWEGFYAQYIQPFSTLWDESLGFLGVKNPIPGFNENVKKQIESGDNKGKKWLGNFISDQINDPGVKPYVDASFMVLLANSWNDDEYPANFVIDLPYDWSHTDITGIQPNEGHGSYTIILENDSRIMRNLDKGKAGRFTFYKEEELSRRSADKLTNFSQARGDTLKLSSMKFDDLESIKYKQVENKNQFKRAKRGKANIIGYERSNRIDLYFDENTNDRGLGDGGIFAILKDKSEELPTLVLSDFVVI